MTDLHSHVPEVSDEDIEWVCRVMGLCQFDQPRRKFLRARTSLDVSSCPGSGNTTLIVAKLAVMARKWPHRTKGICVLSHTNAAREEIQRRLSGTVVGQQLLSYPHFIDTIHGFVNRFLALPWLNSNGFSVAMVDDDVTSAYRRRALTNSDHRTVESYLQRKYSGFDRIRLKDRSLNIGLGLGVPFPAGPSTLTHQIAKRAAEASSKAGYFCFDEMFIWARALIEDCPSIAPLLQHRFPLVIVDEMQDTSDLQVGILESVFPRSSSEVVLQRVGDPNQAIYDGVRNVSSVLDVFPDAATCLKIPNSFRFGPAIATLASPFAIDAAGPDGLQGIGPRSVDGAPKCCPNALLIFQDDEAHRVLDAYGQHVLSTFDDETLAIGDVTAMGARHKDATDVRVGHAHFPKTVSHYWSGYTAEVARRDPHPRTLIQYVRTARALVRDACDLSPGVNKIASGLERIGQSAGSGDALGRRIPGHRTLVEILATNTEALSAYRHLLRVCLIEWEVLTEKLWERLRPDILLIVTGLSGSGTPLNSLDGFLDWDTDKYSFVVPGTASPKDVGPNVYRVDSGAGRSVDIRLGSVHSMKGQTHLATLLLNTYVRGHSAKRMLPWLLGEKVNLSGAGAEDRLRLQQTYVAMTRPSHLICLAIPVSVLGDDVTGYVSILQDRGWHAANVVDGAPCWIE